MHEETQRATLATLHAAAAMTAGVQLYDMLSRGFAITMSQPREGKWYGTIKTTITSREYQAESFAKLVALMFDA